MPVAVYVLAVILLLVVLLLLLRVRVTVNFDGGGLRLMVQAGPVKLALYPLKPRKPKKKKQPPPPPQSAAPPPAEKKGLPLDLIKAALPAVTEAMNRFRKKLLIETLYLDYLAAGEDPAAAALSFGGVNVFLGMLWPILEQNFKIQERRIRTSIDFNSKKPSVFITAIFSLRVGQGLVLGLCFLRTFLKNRPAKGGTQTQKEAV